MQPRSSVAQLPRVSVWHASEQPSPFPGPLPNAFFGQPRFAPELTRTAFAFLSPFRMLCRMRQAQHRFREVPWSDDPAPSLATGLLRLNWTLSSPSGGIVTVLGLSFRQGHSSHQCPRRGSARSTTVREFSPDSGRSGFEKYQKLCTSRSPTPH